MTKDNLYKIGRSANKTNNFKSNQNKSTSIDNKSTSNQKFNRSNNMNNKGKFIKKQKYNDKKNNVKRQFNNSNKRKFNDNPLRMNKNTESNNFNENQRKYQKDSKSFKKNFSSQYTKNNQFKKQNDYTKKQTKQEKNDINLQKTQKDNQKRQQSNKKRSIKHNRIIIRNLVFDINENHLKKLLGPYGKILQINIPKNPDNKGSKGFAFIQFQNRNNCLKAIKQLNGTKYKGRNIILDQSVSKQRYIESKINQQQKNQNKQQSEDQLKDQKIKLEQKKQNQQEQQNEQSIEEQNNNKNETKNQVKKQKTAEQKVKDYNSEIFIRNLPISVKEQDLFQFFRKYGKIKFAKIVMNKQTNVSKGTGFVKFQDPQKAKQLYEYSKNYEMNLLGKNSNFKLNPAINLQLQGTILKVFPVQSRQNIKEKINDRDAKDKQRQQQKDKNKKPIKKIRYLQKLVEYDTNNKRNLKLALLGLNKVTQEMKQSDVQRFTAHEKQKVQKLKNPNNSVSDKRIIFKYLRKDITQQNIRQLCHQYIKQASLRPKDLTYCKLMLQSLQTKKSAGYAFVQFRSHEIALNFLEWISEQPSKLMNQPYICEFAIQDSRKLLKLEKKNKKK